MPSNHLILCRPLLLLFSIFPSIRVFSNESALHIRWPKYWSFSFNLSPSSEHPGLISFRMDWLDLLAVQGSLKTLLQHHSSKAPILQCSAFFTVQLSHPYMTTGRTMALTRRTLLIFKSFFFFFFFCNCMIPHILCISPLPDIWFTDIFFSFHRFSFHFVVSFARQKLFKLMLSHLSIPAFIA